MKIYGGVELWLHAFLFLVLDGDEWPASRPQCFILGEKASGSNSIGCVGPRDNLDDVEKRKILPGIEH
jgi:hypothetical protein